MKFYLYVVGYMPKMADMPIYGENVFKIIFLETCGPISTQLGMWHRGLKPIIDCSNDNPGLTLTFFIAKSKFATNAFYLGKCDDDFFENYCGP